MCRFKRRIHRSEGPCHQFGPHARRFSRSLHQFECYIRNRYLRGGGVVDIDLNATDVDSEVMGIDSNVDLVHDINFRISTELNICYRKRRF